MNGHVDENGRALIQIPIAATPDTQLQALPVWIDTGCTAELVLPRSLIESLRLPSHGAVHVVLADGTEHLSETFVCDLEWLGRRRTVEVVANNRFPLLGVGLLLGHTLNINDSSLRIGASITVVAEVARLRI